VRAVMGLDYTPKNPMGNRDIAPKLG